MMYFCPLRVFLANSVDPEELGWDPWPQGYKTFIMLNSTEHKISTAHKNWNTDK